MAQKAELKAKINLDSSGFKRGIARSKKSVSTFAGTLKNSLLPALGAAGAAGALVGFGRRAIESASQIKELAQVSGLGVVEFQKYAEAAKTVNIEQEKLADIFKDTSDKVGDFINTDGGAMADFFEKIAPLVGATKEEFMGLNGADSLQKYFNYLEQANIPHQEMVFYMEAIASDATMLIPLLENGGEAFKTLGRGAEEAGNIMKETTIEALDEANEEIDRFMQNITVFVGQTLAKLRPAKDAYRELAIQQLEAENAFDKGFIGNTIAVFTGSDGDLIEERIALLKEEADAAELLRMQNEQNALTLAKVASINKTKAKEEEEAAKAKAKADRESAQAQAKADREAAQAKAKADREAKAAKDAAEAKAEAAKEAAEAAKEAAEAKKISDAQLALLKAEAAEESALIVESKKQLELEQSIQGIMESTNLEREEAVKLANQLAQVNAGADSDGSGYVTPREQRAFERKQRKQAQEQRKREREERTNEVGADERARKQSQDERFERRQTQSLFGAGTTQVAGNSTQPNGEIIEPNGEIVEKQMENEEAKKEQMEKELEHLENIDKRLEKLDSALSGD